jgi:hypothetical protein
VCYGVIRIARGEVLFKRAKVLRCFCVSLAGGLLRLGIRRGRASCAHTAEIQNIGYLVSGKHEQTIAVGGEVPPRRRVV